MHERVSKPTGESSERRLTSSESSERTLTSSESSERTLTSSESSERTLTVGGSRPIRISSGHRIQHHEGKCSRPHGHNYEITVELRGELTAEGWIADKGTVTSVIDEWDHRFLLEAGDPLIEAFESTGDGDAVVVLDAPPTAEVMSAVLEARLRERVPETVSAISVTVRETSELAAAGGVA